jgi:mRNA-degrading endonuclease RelE of RelBE toxin-antitoxin system
MFDIEYVEDAAEDLDALHAFKRKKILDRIHEQLVDEPARATKNRKLLDGLKTPWKQERPTWELRVEDFRVFYDVDEVVRIVTIRAIRRKPPHKTTEEIL